MKIEVIFAAFAAALSVISCKTEPMRVACVGDSITEGMAIDWQSENSYPAQLDRLLPETYEVVNFGRRSTTMMRKGDLPYWSVKEFTNVFRYHPDVIVLKLGTNDSKLDQWNAEAFRDSYVQMIDTFKTIVPTPKIMLCLPVPPQQTRWGITDSVVVNGVVPVVRDLAKRYDLELIDLYEAVGHHPELFARDGIHPNKDGAAVMAAEVRKHFPQ